MRFFSSSNPHVKVGIEHFVFKNIFPSAGADNILNKKNGVEVILVWE